MVMERIVNTHAPVQEPRISVYTNRTLGFNNYFVEKYDLFSYSWVDVYCDKEENKIAFKFLKEQIDGAHKLCIKKKQNSKHLYFACFSVIKAMNIDISTSKSYKCYFNDGMWSFNLDENQEDSAGNENEKETIIEVEKAVQDKNWETAKKVSLSQKVIPGFEKFEKPKRGGSKARQKLNCPSTAIYKNGLIFFNMKAVEEYNLKKYNYVELFYSATNNQIAFKFHVEPVAKCYSVIKRKTDIMISGNGFLKNYNIDYSITRRFYPEVVNGTFIISL